MRVITCGIHGARRHDRPADSAAAMVVVISAPVMAKNTVGNGLPARQPPGVKPPCSTKLKASCAAKSSRRHYEAANDNEYDDGGDSGENRELKLRDRACP
jgi:hypothetical protein